MIELIVNEFRRLVDTLVLTGGPDLGGESDSHTGIDDTKPGQVPATTKHEMIINDQEVQLSY